MNQMTIERVQFAVTVVTALGCALMAGLFFAFSVSVMRALARRPPAEGMAAMQSINVAILNPVFLSVFLGTAVACVLVVIASLLRWHEPGAAYLLLGGALYLVGTFLVTMAINVPMNNALEAAVPTDPAAASLWSDYVTRWTLWNHVRAATSFAATASLVIAATR
jgi:uncharacterized membrane protein